MPQRSRRLLFSDGALLLIGLTLVACFPRSGLAIEPLPEQIPIRMVASGQLIQEAAAAVAREPDLRERYLATTNLLYALYMFPREELKPLIALLEQDAPQIQDGSLLGSTRGGLTHFAPELALKLARNSQDPRQRDYWLGEIAVATSKRDLAEARRILQDVKDSAARATAVVEFAEAGKAEFEETKSALTEPTGFGWRGWFGGHRPFTYGTTLAWFVTDHYEEVVGFVRSQLSTEDAVTALCRMADVCRSTRNQPEVAGRLMDAAAELVPGCPDPIRAATTLLNYGYAKHDRDHALKLVDAYWQQNSDPPVVAEQHVLLAATDPESALANAEQIAERFRLPKDKMLIAVLSRIASSQGPNQPLKWLQDTRQSALRDEAVRAIAAALSTFAANHRVTGAAVQEWVDFLSGYALKVSDPKQRWTACDEIHNLARDHEAAAPRAIESERSALFPQVEPGLERIQRTWYLCLFSLDKQRAEIERRWKQRGEHTSELWSDSIRGTAALVRDSSLPIGEKRAWFDRLLGEVRKLPNPTQRAAALSGLAMALSSVDPERSLQVHWEELRLARQLGLKPAFHDASDDLGTVFPLATADEALGFAPGDVRAAGDEVVTALWKFARKLEDIEDRDAVLELLGETLVELQRHQQAAGVASLLTSQVRQARLSATIAAAQSGKTRRD